MVSAVGYGDAARCGIRACFTAATLPCLVSSQGYDCRPLIRRDKSLFRTVTYFEPGVTDMLSFEMVHGSRDGAQESESIMLSNLLRSLFLEMTMR